MIHPTPPKLSNYGPQTGLDGAFLLLGLSEASL